MIEWAVAAKPIPGEILSGDQCVVKTFDGGAIVAVIDALGHGADAERSAHVAVGVIEKHAQEPLDVILAACHTSLSRLRGAVMSLAAFDDRRATLTWVGVGNVEAVLIPGGLLPPRRRERLLVRGGVVGGTLPTTTTATLPIRDGDAVVFATDGVRVDFAERVRFGASLQETADAVLARERTGKDDALVLLARWSTGDATP